MPGHFEIFENYVPVNLQDLSTFFIAGAVVYGFIIVRYFALVGIFHGLYFPPKLKWLGQRLLYNNLPSWNQIYREIYWSLVTSVIFAIMGVVIGLLWQTGWTQIYLKFDTYGLWYLPISWVVLCLLHDTYYYWVHRLIHRRSLYKLIHQTHHESLQPSPWASFSFHPWESLLQALILPLLLLIIPVHPVVLIFHLTFMTLTAIFNHLGFEVLPRSWKWLGLWFISGLHHSQHHRQFNTNYGLFFTFWDRLCCTQNPQFEGEWDRI